MISSFPKMDSSKKSGLGGQAFFQSFVISKLGWLYHQISEENDFGIDGYIEIVDDSRVTGKLIGIQVKHGNSYFSADGNGVITYYGSYKHLNYYLNNKVPIVIVIINDDYSKMLWKLFDIENTSSAGEGWSIEISTNSVLSPEIAEVWKGLVGPIIDYDELIKKNWFIDSIVKKSLLGFVIISKSEVERLDFSTIRSHIKRLAKNRNMLIKKHSTLDLIFYGYDDDPRELYQIPEVMKWLRQSMDEHIPWFYFVLKEKGAAAIRLLIYAFCGVTNIEPRNGGSIVHFDKSKMKDFFSTNYISMNEFMDEHKLDIGLNKLISQKIVDRFSEDLI